MNKSDRIRAFAMRCDGSTWEQIGQAMSYDGQSVAKDLHTVLKKAPRRPAIRYPALANYVLTHCGGSIEVFARGMHVSPHRLRRVLVHGDEPSGSLCQKLLEATGLPEETVFARDGSRTCMEGEALG